MKASLKRAKKLYKAKRYENALNELLSLDTGPHEEPEISYYLGLCYTRMEDYDNALLHLEQVVTLNSDILQKYQSRMVLSYIYTISGRLSLAVFELNSLLNEGYESAQVYASLSFISYQQKKIEESIDYLEKAVRLDPENSNALNSLGYILADEGRDVLKGLSLCKRAVSKQPDNPAYLDSLGWAYFKMGRYDEAKENLRRALRITRGEQEKVVADHLRQIIIREDK